MSTGRRGGPFGGVRAAVQLRMMLGELGMPSIPSTFPVPKVGQAFDEQGTPADSWKPRRSIRAPEPVRVI